MAVDPHHGKGWAVFLPSNALLADRDHGAVKIEMGGERLVKELLNATWHLSTNIRINSWHLSHRAKLISRIRPTCLNSYCFSFLGSQRSSDRKCQRLQNAITRLLPGPSPTDNCVGKVEMSRMNKIRPSVIYRVTRASLYYAIVTAKKKKKRFHLLLWHKNPKGLREAHVYTFQSKSLQMGVGEQGSRHNTLELKSLYLMPSIRANLNYEKISSMRVKELSLLGYQRTSFYIKGKIKCHRSLMVYSANVRYAQKLLRNLHENWSPSIRARDAYQSMCCKRARKDNVVT